MLRIERIAATSPLFEEIRDIRRRVFVEEQGVSPANEFDDTDREALHFLAWLDDAAVGTARLYGEGGVARIGRVAVLASVRGRVWEAPSWSRPCWRRADSAMLKWCFMRRHGCGPSMDVWAFGRKVRFTKKRGSPTDRCA